MLKLLLIINVITKTHELTYNKIVNNSLKTNNIEQQFHEELLKKLYQQKIYEGVLILNENAKHLYCNNFLEYLQFQEMPTMVITGNTTKSYGKYFNNQIICIACMTSYQHNILEQLALILNNMRYTRIIMITDRWSSQLDMEELNEFFRCSQKLKMLNVAVIFRDFFQTRKYIQFTIFPEFKLEFGLYNVNSSNLNILPERFRNLKGYKLRTIADHYEPRAMEYYNENNETVLNGYLGRFVKTISETLNATLYFPLQIPHDKLIDYLDILNYISNYSIDVPACTTAVSESEEPRDFSYPFEMSKWCLMLPMEKSIEFKELFLMVLSSEITLITLIFIALFTIVFYLSLGHHRWSEIIINDMAIRGVLGQSFVMPAYRNVALKLIYLMLMLCGLTISTVFGCYLLTFCTQPPLEPEIKTYQDLAKSPLKVAIFKREFEQFHNITNGSLAYMYSSFYILSAYPEYSRLRDSFDRRFAFHAITSKLFYYNSLQAYFSKKFFRYSTKMCPVTMMQFVFPLGKNSYFIPRLDEIILNTLQSGLMDYWISYSYQDVLATGRAIRVNISYEGEDSPLYVYDLYWIWICYLILIAVAIVVFMLELLINKIFKN